MSIVNNFQMWPVLCRDHRIFIWITMHNTSQMIFTEIICLSFIYVLESFKHDLHTSTADKNTESKATAFGKVTADFHVSDLWPFILISNASFSWRTNFLNMTTTTFRSVSLDSILYIMDQEHVHCGEIQGQVKCTHNWKLLCINLIEVW